jgi:hypothetical protein
MYGSQFQYTVLPLLEKQINTSGAAIVLDMNNLFDILLIGTVPITAPATISVSNDNNVKEFYFMFEVDASLPALTMPADFFFDDANFSAGVWTPPAAGLYEMHGVWDGTQWRIDMSGPYSG